MNNMYASKTIKEGLNYNDDEGISQNLYTAK